MLDATQQERDDVLSYMASQAADLEVEFAQKVYAEVVLGHRHDVWDVHTDVDRWWVITPPMNLYAQAQFPNMDLALTFHIGLSVRMPRADRVKPADLPVEPFLKPLRSLSEASDALRQAKEVADYQAIGVRCREALLAFVDAGQIVLPWNAPTDAPKRADFKAWVDHVCSVALAGASQKDRRQLIKTLLDVVWNFSNWLTHAKGSTWRDAEAAISTAERAVGLCIQAMIQHTRGVPDVCPACGSPNLSPQRAVDPERPDEEWERPACTECGWAGTPVHIHRVPTAPIESERCPPEGECVVPTVPLRNIERPGGKHA